MGAQRLRSARKAVGGGEDVVGDGERVVVSEKRPRVGWGEAVKLRHGLQLAFSAFAELQFLPGSCSGVSEPRPFPVSSMWARGRGRCSSVAADGAKWRVSSERWAQLVSEPSVRPGDLV